MAIHDPRCPLYQYPFAHVCVSFQPRQCVPDGHFFMGSTFVTSRQTCLSRQAPLLIITMLKLRQQTAPAKLEPAPANQTGRSRTHAPPKTQRLQAPQAQRHFNNLLPAGWLPSVPSSQMPGLATTSFKYFQHDILGSVFANARLSRTPDRPRLCCPPVAAELLIYWPEENI
ncbi:hypothetical protein IF1G_02030 [Cordyceps javanica]|uniref:Uncharacterized protein n=1 Tax=Cordyceps javanica TaxID=43265 RepID=A0A545VDM6_9HYPO|nr:hypothetical protein IF1G_02030 [Cordyceps javanica]